MEALIVGTKDQLKIEVIGKLSSGKLSMKEAQALLQKSERTIRRWRRSYEKKNLAFVYHGNKGRVPSNKTSSELRVQVMRFVEAELYDFNMLHALEKVEAKFNLKIPRETFRRWCHKANLVKQAHHTRRARPRFRRPRFSKSGFMLQLDGSPHRWFGNETSCLIAAIDDATSRVVGGEFFETESMFGTFKVLSDIFEINGLPSVLYVDRAGMYGGQKRTNFSQLVRALDELGVQIIYANSPEGKGRIERLFKTLQDRLVPEMRLANIASYEQANRYLKEIYLPHLHNPRFAVEAEDTNSAWRSLARHQKLEDVFCIKEKRRVARDHTFSYEADKYLITSDLKFSIFNHDIELRIDKDGKLRAIFAGRELDYVKVEKCPKRMAA